MVGGKIEGLTVYLTTLLTFGLLRAVTSSNLHVERNLF